MIMVMLIPSRVVRRRRRRRSECVSELIIVEIEEGEDEKSGEDFLTKSKGKDQEMFGEDNNNEDNDSDFDIDETDLESYSTILEVNEDIDEFQILCESLQSNSSPSFLRIHAFSSSSELQMDTTGYYQALVQNLTPEQQTQIQNIINYTEKRKQEKGERNLFRTKPLFFFV